MEPISCAVPTAPAQPEDRSARPDPRTHERRVLAMGSDVHLVVVGGAPGLADAALDRLEELEARWSRFRDSSEVSELTRRAGGPVAVSDDTMLLVRRALQAWWLTGGAFDPTVLGDVVRAGYDRTFEDLRSWAGRGAEQPGRRM